MNLLSKIAKTAAILVAAVFVLVLVIVGAFLGPPLHDAFKYVHQAEADGRIDARTWQEAGLPGPVGNALVTMEFAPQYHTFIPGFHSAPSAFVEIARLITNQHEHSIRRDFTDVFIIQILARKYRADQLVDDCARMTYFGRHTYGAQRRRGSASRRPAFRSARRLFSSAC